MAPTKSNRKKAKPTTQRKSSRRKNGTNARPKPTLQDKENKSPTINGQDPSSSSPQANTIDDPHEQNWWKLNVQKAVSLIERCMKAYSWDRNETKRILNSYREFLLLKKEHADWDAEIFYPCWPVDRMWFEHSQMEDYDYDMKNLLGHVINRASSSVMEEEEKIVATQDALKQRFGSYDKEVWDYIQINMTDQLGQEESFGVNRREPLANVFHLCTQNKEEGRDQFLFEFDGKTLNEKDDDGVDTTPMRLGMNDNCTIEVSHIDKVAIAIRHSLENKEQLYLIDKSSMMSKTFDDFAKEVLDTERTKLVFLLREKRIIYGYESPIALNLKCRGDVIDAVALESHKSKNCICCNPNPLDIGNGTSRENMASEDSLDDASVA